MDLETLRAVQEPLKAQYRDDPDTAIITLEAEGELGAGITCSVKAGSAMAQAGLHPATGGDGLS
ncbi:MAG: OsmC family peroxiredoxin, partial [Acidimicrobiia bacterium]|nr:OsmC family peroxiredoxin [Acidimicrobiia bacterium]